MLTMSPGCRSCRTLIELGKMPKALLVPVEAIISLLTFNRTKPSASLSTINTDPWSQFVKISLPVSNQKIGLCEISTFLGRPHTSSRSPLIFNHLKKGLPQCLMSLQRLADTQKSSRKTSLNICLPMKQSVTIRISLPLDLFVGTCGMTDFNKLLEC